MLVPAAASAPPIAVLVLAWDEATPAVRALVAATQASAPAIDSILVMVPQADAPGHLSAEEYLPVNLPPPVAPAAAAPATEPLPVPPPVVSTVSPELQRVLAEALEAGCEPAAVGLLPEPAPLQPPAPALAWSAVRVLRLGSLSLPQAAQLAGQPLPAPTWLGNSTAPAAPYLGASAVTSNSSKNIIISQSIGYELIADLPKIATEPALLTTLPSGNQPVTKPATILPAAESLYEPANSIAQAPDPEADLQPSAAPASPAFELPLTDPASTEAAALAPSTPPEQAGWPEALAALRQPTPAPAPASAASEAAGAMPTHPALRPAAAHYPTPDLNFQIIQYARFAVPVALAEPPFAAIYAPAWPTWLAAQELRQRTGRPLVLHVAMLAAPAAESVETATGWIAELQRQALRRADLILTETPALAQRLRQELELAFEAVQVVPAADTEAIARALHGAQPLPAASLS